ncbi:MAG: heme-dependent oxidative N-demethylase subunit alpha family protein [Caldimonas sp.]|nr:DUF3445 domain-containing protein [Pseudomonadota bacterium]
MPFDFSQVVAPFRMQPGLRRVAPETAQLTPAHPGGRHLREKIAVLSSFADQALLASPGFDERPILSALAAEAERWEAPAFVQESAFAFAAPRLGWAVEGSEVRGDGDASIGALLIALPLAQRATALLCLAFEEDFALIDGDDATIPWLAVCLPSRWAPEDKVGRHFSEVHAPVADNALLVAASESLARLVTGDDRWARVVWTVSADPRLHQHPARLQGGWPTDADVDAIGALAAFRHEYQTFIPLLGRRQAVFTIRVQSEPLASSLLRREDAWRLHAALSSMSPAVLAYRGLDPVRDRLLAWLAQHAATLPEVAS